MSLTHYALAVVSPFAASSLTDWFFMGFLFHEKYAAYPEVWRNSVTGGNESGAIAWSMLFTAISCAVFVYCIRAFALPGLSHALAMTICVWIAIPVPSLITNGLFMRIHPLVTLSHSLAWLAKLLACSLSANYWL